MKTVTAALLFVFLQLGVSAHAQEDRDPRLDIPGPEYSTRNLTVCQRNAADELIQLSIAEYKAEDRPCACPYDFFRDGITRCEEASAYIRTNGEEPLCSRDDVKMETLRKICGADEISS